MKQELDIFESPHLSAFDEPEEPELEFTHFTFECHNDIHLMISTADTVVKMLTDGWQIEGQITCPLFVSVFFSREKETTDE